MANWLKKLLNDDADNENEFVMPNEDEDTVEDVNNTNDEMNLEDEVEDETEDDLYLTDEDEELDEDDEVDEEDEDEEDEEDEEDTDSLIQEMLQQDIDHRDNYLSKSAELQKKIDELKRQQGMD